MRRTGAKLSDVKNHASLGVNYVQATLKSIDYSDSASAVCNYQVLCGTIMLIYADGMHYTIHIYIYIHIIIMTVICPPYPKVDMMKLPQDIQDFKDT